IPNSFRNLHAGSRSCREMLKSKIHASKQVQHDKSGCEEIVRKTLYLTVCSAYVCGTVSDERLVASGGWPGKRGGSRCAGPASGGEGADAGATPPPHHWPGRGGGAGADGALCRGA